MLVVDGGEELGHEVPARPAVDAAGVDEPRTLGVAGVALVDAGHGFNSTAADTAIFRPGGGMSRSTGTRRIATALVAAALGFVVLIATACGSDDAGTSGGSTTTAPAGEAPAGGATETTPGGGGAAPSTAAPAGPGATTGGAGAAQPPGGQPGGQPGAQAGPAFTGLWAGEYMSTVPANADGTFTVVFEGSAPNYTGSIVIAGLCEPDCPITATVTGNTIGFGSVGPRAVTYKGTVSGSSMSGTYAVGSEGQGEGTWKAVKA